jgi:hypothetical protein
MGLYRSAGYQKSDMLTVQDIPTSTPAASSFTEETPKRLRSTRAASSSEFVVCVFTRNILPDMHYDATLLSFGEVSRRMWRDQVQTPLQGQRTSVGKIFDQVALHYDDAEC